MTEVLVETPTAAAPARRRRVAVVAVAVAVVALVGLALRSYAVSPTLLPFPAGGMTGAVPVGATLYTDAGIVPDATPSDDGSVPVVRMDLVSVTPHLADDAARADVTVLVCTRIPGTNGVGAQTEVPTASCSRLAPFAGPQVVPFGFDSAQIVVAVTPHATGSTHLAGFDVTYARGPWRTTQRVGTDITVTGTAAP